MNVLHELKTSISRSSLRTTTPLKTTASKASLSSQSTIVLSFSPLASPAPAIEAGSPQSCPATRTPEPDPYIVSDAMPSAYWSGRFMSLFDKFSTQALIPIPPGHIALQATDAGTGLPSTLTALPETHHPLTAHPTTRPKGAGLSTNPRDPATEQEEILQRVFRRLECMCSTEEAKASLQEWRQAYAQKYKQPHLLPYKRVQRTSQAQHQENKISKWIGSGRRSLSSLKEAAASGRSAKRVATERGPVPRPM
ncbi:uncharacterized protein F5Z01DRAFT_673889 [Emericellopsis atlantica]|uniref:Uncharacterized protein n=1 Tax=Emericellopsis atlantica TaxID=2614577 RepID=A0A9P8CPD3_9HYPO|nr:uncharacterized protein F5Z01DRAFT_673889 [Emericellopsis atlantica]KAG9254744.1 hypothetical protein F5Z01DRAFT_673889 [Emericellopsis atlantica]